jgi:hypothetical protein
MESRRASCLDLRGRFLWALPYPRLGLTWPETRAPSQAEPGRDNGADSTWSSEIRLARVFRLVSPDRFHVVSTADRRSREPEVAAGVRPSAPSGATLWIFISIAVRCAPLRTGGAPNDQGIDPRPTGIGAVWSSAAPVRTTGEPGSGAATPCPLTSRISGERVFAQVTPRLGARWTCFA